MTIIGVVLLVVGLLIVNLVYDRVGALGALIVGFLILGAFMVLFGVTDSRTGEVLIKPLAQ